jgi:pimeloyl-ACP methyl ester carboxylesterase
MVGGQLVYYEISGRGPPLILIRGLGSSAAHWHAQIPVLSDHFTVIAFDHRGIGRSPQATTDGCSIESMAADTLSLMDALGFCRAHVLGVSMGGMIAQEIAITHPERVLGLVLASTHCGGCRAVRPDPRVVDHIRQWVETGKPQDFEMALTCFFSPKTCQCHPDIIDRFRETSRRFGPVGNTLALQWQAITAHDAGERLGRIDTPTLVIIGSHDILVPPENAEILKDLIPDARIKIVAGGGHVVHMEQPGIFNAEVMNFLCQVAGVAA